MFRKRYSAPVCKQIMNSAPGSPSFCAQSASRFHSGFFYFYKNRRPALHSGSAVCSVFNGAHARRAPCFCILSAPVVAGCSRSNTAWAKQGRCFRLPFRGGEGVMACTRVPPTGPLWALRISTSPALTLSAYPLSLLSITSISNPPCRVR